MAIVLGLSERSSVLKNKKPGVPDAPGEAQLGEECSSSSQVCARHFDLHGQPCRATLNETMLPKSFSQPGQTRSGSSRVPMRHPLLLGGQPGLGQAGAGSPLPQKRLLAPMTVLPASIHGPGPIPKPFQNPKTLQRFCTRAFEPSEHLGQLPDRERRSCTNG